MSNLILKEMKVVQLFKSTIYQLRSQPLLTWVNISGTALAIFLIMIVVMLQQVKTASFEPESNRDRMLHYKYNSVIYENGYSNGGLSYGFYKQLLQPLEIPEAVTCFDNWKTRKVVSEVGGRSMSVNIKRTDANFWKVFDFTFVSGKPYTNDDFNTGVATAVIDSSVAKKLFGIADVAGREFMVNGQLYTIAGVVEPVSELADRAYSQVWVNLSSNEDINLNNYRYFTGGLGAVILAKSVDDFPAIKKEIEQRTAELNRTLAAEQTEIVTHERPYTQAVHALNTMPNEDPNPTPNRNRHLLIYLILLIVPAINLLTMTQSRLRQRVSEIAIRRAFGCKKDFVMADILTENMILSVIAGIIGLSLSVWFAYTFDSYLFTQRGQTDTTASLPALIQWSTFGWTLLFCFILNVLSSAVPAWKVSRESLAGALTGHDK